jgi:hypothetical protein
MANVKISQLTAKGSKIASTDRLAIAQDTGGGTFASKYVTGEQINEVLLDTSPQLGGDLDVNGNKITSASNGNVKIEPNGTGAVLIGGNDTQPSELRFMELLSNGSSYVGFKAPNDIITSRVYTLPTTDGTNGQVLQTNGSGVLSWSSASGGVPTTRNITINGTTQDLSTDRTYTVTDANLSTSDITTNDVSTTKHGFAPKAPNDATKFLDGTGAYSNPTPDWVDYSSTSTVVGWSSFTTKFILYKKVGKQVFVFVTITGTSNATNATFTLPDNNTSTIGMSSLSLSITNNGVGSNTPGRISTSANSNIIDCAQNRTGTAFTASGTKAVSGVFFYFID